MGQTPRLGAAKIAHSLWLPIDLAFCFQCPSTYSQTRKPGLPKDDKPRHTCDVFRQGEELEAQLGSMPCPHTVIGKARTPWRCV